MIFLIIFYVIFILTIIVGSAIAIHCYNGDDLFTIIAVNGIVLLVVTAFWCCIGTSMLNNPRVAYDQGEVIYINYDEKNWYAE